MPANEYILNAIHLYADNKITNRACLEFIELINLKKREQMTELSDLAAKHGICISFKTPLDPLINKLKDHDDIVLELMSLTKLPMLLLFENEKLVAEKLLEYMAVHSNEYNPIWEKALSQIQSGKIDRETLTLGSLAYISYAANIATPKLQNTDSDICAIHPGHEKKIQLSYKHLFCSEWGNIFFVNWLPPILIKSEAHHNGLFFINNKLNKRVKSLMNLNIVEHVFKSIGSLAVNNPQQMLYHMERIFLTLCAIHPRKTIEKILKGLIDKQ